MDGRDEFFSNDVRRRFERGSVFDGITDVATGN